MKFKLLKIGSIALAMSLLTLPAKAGEVDFALGITGNFADFDTTGSETEGWGYGDVIAGTETTSTSISKSVDFASAFGEVVFKHGFLGLTWGAEILPGERSLGAKTRTDSSSGADIAAEADTGDNTAKAQVANMLSTYLEPTIYIHDAIGIYAKFGASRVSVETLESLHTDSSYGNKGVFGTITGAGIRASHSSGIFIKLEYAETDYGSITFESQTGNRNTVTASPEQEATRLSIGYKF